MPGDAGVVFITLSDETGITNVVVWPRLVETFRREIMGARLLAGRRQGAEKPKMWCIWWPNGSSTAPHELDRLSEDTLRPFQGQLEDLAYQRPDSRSARHPRQVRILPKSRDFH